MKIALTWPPNIATIRAALDISGVEPVFTYGDTIYNPYKHHIDAALMAHEETHERQQRDGGPDLWWQRYLDDPQFRAEQEIAAYRAQFRKLKKLRAKRDSLAMCLKDWAGNLAGPMYGGCVPYAVAMVRIKS